MSETCKTCKFWNTDYAAEYCEAINDSHYDPKHDADACVQDYEGYSATFYSGPDFGCTKWEAMSE